MKTAIALILSFILTSCSQTKKREPQTVRINLYTEPASIDPRRATDNVSAAITKMVYDGLVRIDENQTVQPALAKSWEVSADQKTYTFHLRDAQWSDRTPILASDFTRGWFSALHPEFPSETATHLFVIKNAKKYKEGLSQKEDVGIRAIDDKTIEVTLEYPTPYFLELTTHSPYPPLPPSKGDDYASSIKPAQNIQFCGPFILHKFRYHDELVLKKNPNYWDRDNVRLETIHFYLIQDPSTELALFERGDLDWAGAPFSTLPLEALQKMERKEKQTVYRYPIAATYYYIFNTAIAPFDNVHARRAFSYAIDRENITRHLLQENQQPATSLVPPTIWKKTKSYFNENDPISAQEEWKKTKYAKSFPRTYLSYNTLEAHSKIAQAIQHDWKKTLDINVKLENKEWKVFLHDLNTNHFQVARMGGSALYDDPMTFLEPFQSRDFPDNRTGWENKRYKKLIEKAKEEINPQKRLKYLSDAEKILMDEMPICPIYFYTQSYIKNPKLKGVYLSPLGGVDLRNAYMEDESD